METIKSLLERCKEVTGAENKNQLAEKTGIKSQRISDYYNETRSPDEYDCLLIAKTLEMELSAVLAIARIEAEKDETRKEAWKGYLKSIGGYAERFLMSLFLVVTLIVTPTTAKAAPVLEEATQDFVLCKKRTMIVATVVLKRGTRIPILPRDK